MFEGLRLGYPPFFFRLASTAFPDSGSVGWIEKKTIGRRPSTSASLQWATSNNEGSFRYCQKCSNLGRLDDDKSRKKRMALK